MSAVGPVAAVDLTPSSNLLTVQKAGHRKGPASVPASTAVPDANRLASSTATRYFLGKGDGQTAMSKTITLREAN
jgi:hypothetical protein